MPKFQQPIVSGDRVGSQVPIVHNQKRRPDGSAYVKIYLAASGMMHEAFPIMRKWFDCTKVEWYELRSFFELQKFTGHRLPVWGTDLFLDSGAFSGFSLNKPIKKEEYLDFMLRHKESYYAAANLDEIPGMGSEDSTSVEYAAEQTYKNQQWFEERGANPIPVFHKGEDWSYLHRYLDEGYDYIALGGLVKTIETGTIQEFFDEVFRRICDNYGRPGIKIHAFGMTDIKTMLAYPFYSCDSTSWHMQSKLGQIYVPRKVDGKYIYDTGVQQLAVSNRSSLREVAGKHYNSLSDTQQAYVREYLDTLGETIENVSGDNQDTKSHPHRFHVNQMFFLNLQKEATFSDRFVEREFTVL